MNILLYGAGVSGTLAVTQDAVWTVEAVDWSVFRLYSSSHCVIAMESLWPPPDFGLRRMGSHSLILENSYGENQITGLGQRCSS